MDFVKAFVNKEQRKDLIQKEIQIIQDNKKCLCVHACDSCNRDTSNLQKERNTRRKIKNIKVIRQGIIFIHLD